MKNQPLTKQQKIELRGVWNGTCNELKCLAPDPRWLDEKHGSYVCAMCAAGMNVATPGRCKEKKTHEISGVSR